MNGDKILKNCSSIFGGNYGKKIECPFVRSVAYTGKHRGKKGRFTFTPPVRLEVTIPMFDLPL